MSINFTRGESQEFVATRDFALNWEDRKIKSVKVRKNETIIYDGDIATYRTPRGEIISGKCPSLRSAINIMGWLALKNGIAQEPMIHPAVKSSSNVSTDYDGVKGGSFDTYGSQNRGGVYVAPNAGSFRKLEIVQENDLIVKSNISPKKASVNLKRDEKMEVAGDQVEVRSGFTVSSSTSGTKENKRKMEVVQADEGGSSGTIPINMGNIKKADAGNKKKNSYIVDERTPAIPAEDVTLRDVQKITKTSGTSNVIRVEESQDAMVVGTIDMKRGRNQVQEIEGITLKRPVPQKTDGITFAKIQKPKEMTVKATVTSGSTAIVDAQEEGTVVVKMKTAEEKEALAKAAAAKAAARKASSVKTETEVLKGKKKEPAKFDAVKGGSFEDFTAEPVSDVHVATAPTAKVEAKPAATEDNIDFLSMLPEDWGTMHWVKKEKFIKSLTDKAFIKFIFSVESIKAVQNACTERLKELEQNIPG
jgi:hypothetical protein